MAFACRFLLRLLRCRLFLTDTGSENAKTVWAKTRSGACYPKTAVNFYAHMVSASWQRRDASFALGAMLPDFATMLGIRLPDQPSGELRDGIEFHHHSDKLFHGLDDFRREEQHAFRYWRERGLRRGPHLQPGPAAHRPVHQWM